MSKKSYKKREDIGDSDVECKLLEQCKLQVEPQAVNNVEKLEKVRTAREQINELLHEMPLTDDITCGFWIFKGKFFQRFANQTCYVILYGLVGCVFAMTYAYFNGTITTLEKRFKIPSKNTGIIAIGNNITQMIVSAVLSYYAGKGHRPRWIGFGILTIVIFCALTALPHFLYGPGEDALALTSEFGGIADENATQEAIEAQRAKTLCRHRDIDGECEVGEGNLAPQLVLFAAQMASGIGGALYYTLGVAYMDDNTKKSKTPALLSLSYFFHMLGPAIGYALASLCLRVYIAPHLRPVINNSDPRWMGAWWMGWLLLGTVLSIAGILFTMLPKELPKAAARRLYEERRLRAEKALEAKKNNDLIVVEAVEQEEKASFADMLRTFKRLVTNKTLMYNNISSVFYFFGYTPYWIFTPKYIEIQYRQSAATSSMVTGTVALAFSAIGVLLSGVVISKYKPRARYMAAWNVIVDYLTVIGIVAYAFIGCPGNEQSVVVNIHDNALSSIPTCNSACSCDYVQYSPVCGTNNMTYISPCHAGCRKQNIDAHGKKTYYDCSCITIGNSSFDSSTLEALFPQRLQLNYTEISNSSNNNTTTWTPILPTSLNAAYADSQFDGQATPGACPVDCFAQFVTFLAVMCCLKFVGATGRASNFLVSVRCVPEKDKTAAMGFGMMMMCMVTFIPSPIFFGWLLDRLCLVWGKTCTNHGNCWLYDPVSLRYTLNLTAAVFIAIGGIFDAGVWYYVKDLKIFDDEVKAVEMQVVEEEEQIILEGKI